MSDYNPLYDEIAELRRDNELLSSNLTQARQINDHIMKLVAQFSTELNKLFDDLESKNWFKQIDLAAISPYLAEWWQQQKQQRFDRQQKIEQIRSLLANVPEDILADAGLQRIAT